MGAQVHLNSHSGIVDMGGLLLKFLTSNHMNLLVCSVWAMGCTTLLWHDIMRPFINWFSHVDRKWGHVFLALLGHRV